ncbi:MULTISPECIES: hypothetical protein [Acinetobacter]|jgi:hypothetical protein|uniref:DUF4199 domain-containing protein n=1 Tax=Acinetobacter tibetensis TaxID=2943497 RepID=A0AAE9RZL5_9GAMM|nr:MULTISPECIES: hypothetical protein [Acinetobacter]PWB15432.1 hypothetical protein DCO44_05880 [Acinetobacter sp. AM]USE82731.1 hypothetical protein M5E07_13195 [Acinetobacter tibetensis]
MSDNTSPEKSPWGWKALIIATILSIIFLVVFYLAMQNEPDYMPGKQREARAAQASSAAAEHTMDMSAEEHAAMTESSASTAHNGH